MMVLLRRMDLHRQAAATILPSPPDGRNVLFLPDIRRSARRSNRTFPKDAQTSVWPHKAFEPLLRF